MPNHDHRREPPAASNATPRYLLFDFFGTLVDYHDGIQEERIATGGAFVRAAGCAHTDSEVAQELDAVWRDLDEEARRTLREPHFHTASARLLGRLSLRSDPDLVVGFTEAFIEDWAEGITAIDGVQAMIQRLDLPASVVSNTYYPPVVSRQLEQHGLSGLFEHVMTSVEHGFRKPHPSIYKAALSKIDVPSSDVLFVGDNPECDYHGPRRAGMAAVLVSSVPVSGVPEKHRIAHILELENWLGVAPVET
jgi:putative hydrolase of the HAD superfamily